MTEQPTCNYIEPTLHHLAVPIGEVSPDPANARLHPQRNLEVIKGSLKGFRQQKPIVLDADGICLAGNGTLAAARALGWTHIAAVRSTLRGAEGRAYSIADNRATDTSEWDDDVLKQHLDALQDDPQVDALLTGFDSEDVAALLANADSRDEQAGPEASIHDLFNVLISCEDEAQQRALYERLTTEGYACRVLTL